MICMYCGEPVTNGHVCLKCKTQGVALSHKNANALEKLGSDLLYIILKTVDARYWGTNVIHPAYLEFLVDRFEEFEPYDLKVCKDEMIYELREANYLENESFLDDLDDLFEADTKVYQLIRSAYQEAKGDEV